ncbi:NAD(P)H-dependent oxidoreductase [Pseudahrensia aquimaris]|uniref:NAD(P)H-dependent oxidoreductase n=1 Tax=Pseudahrensia aquimaris TaxID=744461 RepID=A0ABW3F8N2_9HYPH
MSRIVIVQGHPDGSTKHYCHALAEAYQRGAEDGGHHVDVIDLGKTEVSILRSKVEWESDEDLPEFVVDAQRLIEKSDHLVFIYPLWLGSMPALVKAWIEQVLRASFAFSIVANGKGWEAKLGGRTARVVVTMGMPALVYRLFYFSHSLRSLERNILKFAGVKPVRSTIIGSIESKDGGARKTWLEKMEAWGRGCR